MNIPEILEELRGDIKHLPELHIDIEARLKALGLGLKVVIDDNTVSESTVWSSSKSAKNVGVSFNTSQHLTDTQKQIAKSNIDLATDDFNFIVQSNLN